MCFVLNKFALLKVAACYRKVFQRYGFEAKPAFVASFKMSNFPVPELSHPLDPYSYLISKVEYQLSVGFPNVAYDGDVFISMVLILFRKG